MNKKIQFLKYFIAITILISPFIYKFSQKYIVPGINEQKFLSEVYPEASSFSEKIKNPPHYKAYNKSNELLGIVFLSSDIFPDEKGYAGPIKILTAMDIKGNINNIKIIYHSETPSYAGGITLDWFYKQYKGLSLENKFMIGEDIDGITRATVTVTAINRIIKKSIRYMGKKIFNLSAPKDEEFIYLDMLINRDIPLVLGLFTIAVIAFKTKKKIIRNITLILGIFYLGFFKENFFSIISVLNILFGKFPDSAGNFIWYVFLGAIIFTTIIWGRIYCYYLCPFGGLQEFIYKLNRLKTVPPSNSDEKAAKIKFIILWIIVMVTSITGNFFLTAYEPFATIFGRTGTVLSWMLVFAALLAGFIYNRFWCRYFCAVGAVLDFLSKFRLKKS